MIRLQISRDPFSAIGAMLATIAGILFLVVFLLALLGLHTSPYEGIVAFMLLPGAFILGLCLIPIGLWRDRRRRRSGKPAPAPWPRLDLNDPHQRHVAFWVICLSLVNVLIISLAAYSGVRYMDSVSFCGQVCHSVMAPEFAAYQDSPHSRVGCVECHIGEGAGWFVRSKLSGTRQVFAVMFHTYSTPIPTPVHNLRPARETCEHCHWPEKFHGDKIVEIPDYADDEKNTLSKTTLRVHVGGGSDKLSIATGIHWHMNVANVVEYIATDDARQVIPWVKITDREGNAREYQAEGVTAEQLAKGERRRMDCIDCHSRPSHEFAATPERAVNGALAMGEIPTALPFVKREATAALKATYANAPAALDGIAAKLREFYRTQYSEFYMGKRQDVERAVSGTQAIYKRNVFPALGVTFGTHPNNIGHMDFPGCFRCHDENHKTKDGKTIGQTCDLCHDIQ